MLPEVIVRGLPFGLMTIAIALLKLFGVER
jgi:hypothetical protein